jgi:hypothetical protein
MRGSRQLPPVGTFDGSARKATAGAQISQGRTVGLEEYVGAKGFGHRIHFPRHRSARLSPGCSTCFGSPRQQALKETFGGDRPMVEAHQTLQTIPPSSISSSGLEMNSLRVALFRPMRAVGKAQVSRA